MSEGYYSDWDAETVALAAPHEGDPINHPAHYAGPVPGIECIDVTQHFSFMRGNAIKYLWRADYKGSKAQDLQKAIWYIQRELDMDTL